MYCDKWTIIGAMVGICLGNKQDKFQLHMLPKVKISQKKVLVGCFFD